MNLANITLSILLLFSSAITLADHDRDHGERRRGGDQIGFPDQPLPNMPFPQPASRSTNVELQINNFFQGMNQVDLLEDFNVLDQLQDRRIRDVTVVASSEMGRGEVQLMLNGQLPRRGEIISQGLNSYTFIVDQYSNTLGQNLQMVSLNLRGRIFIQKVVFNLEQQDSRADRFPQPTPRNEIISQAINQRINEEGGFELFRLFGLGMSRQGQMVRRVSITGRSVRGMGMADLILNGQAISPPQRINEFSNTVTFDLGSGLRIGQEIRSLQIHLRGMIQVDDVSIEFENQMSSPRLPDRGSRRFEQMVNQRLYDTNGIELSRLLMIPSQMDNQIVDSVELTLRNADFGTKLSLCQAQLGQFQRIECGNQVFVSQGRQVVRLTLPGMARLRDISLAVRMGMIDLDSIAINFR